MVDDDWKLPWAGGCRCDRVRFRVTAAPLLGFACHCTGCQRMTASAYSLNLAIPSAGLELVAGEPVIGGLHGRRATITAVIARRGSTRGPRATTR